MRARDFATYSPQAMESARILIDIGAVLFRPDDPFTLTSGRKSPVYVDCRKIISYPRARKRLMHFLAEALYQQAGSEAFDAVAGGETAGIPFAAWLADTLSLPMLYVRKKPKGFGRMAQIEGDMTLDARVLLVEDMATDGGSKMLFVKALRDAGAQVDHIAVIFHYGLFPDSIQQLQKEGLHLLGLTTWWEILRVAEEKGDLAGERLASVQAFLENPGNWEG